MIGENPFEAALVMVFFIATVLFYIEAKEYYLGEAAAKKVNIMYTYRITELSTKGVICGIIAATSFVTLLLMYLQYNSSIVINLP